MSPDTWKDRIEYVDEATQIIPEGEYLVRVTEVALANAQSSGAEMIRTTVTIQNGPYAGRSLLSNIVFSFDNPQAMRMLFRRLNGLGITKEWLAETDPSVSEIAEAVLGRSALAKVTQREWQGEIRNDIGMFLESRSAGGDFVAPAITTSPGLDGGVSLPAPTADDEFDTSAEPF